MYLLDGLRAQDDFNGWDINTQALRVVPRHAACRSSCRSVASPASTPTGTRRPATRARPSTYKWETFLTQELPQLPAGQQGRVKPTGSAAVGLSMAGSAAMILAI